ncbi:MAG: hypothetical protein Q4B36_03065 [Tissierellia bacterium]|nr:hypothetical protein [Tissierellia bacterium]
MSKNKKITLAVVIAIIVCALIYSLKDYNFYERKLAGETYYYVFDENEEEYKHGYRFNFIGFEEDKVIFYIVEYIDELPDNVDIKDLGYRQFNREFPNPVYDKKTKTVTVNVDGSEESIKVIDKDNIEYLQKKYVRADGND